MSSRNIYRVLSTLLAKGYLLRAPWGYAGNAFQYAINVECEIFDGYENSIAITNHFDDYIEPREEKADQPYTT